MKVKLSISMDKELVNQAKSIIEEGRFRNKSHIIEYALKSFLKEESK
jgi:Arc/MetJ-type ribon-helix-helix transcriptional regulator